MFDKSVICHHMIKPRDMMAARTGNFVIYDVKVLYEKCEDCKQSNCLPQNELLKMTSLITSIQEVAVISRSEEKKINQNLSNILIFLKSAMYSKKNKTDTILYKKFYKPETVLKPSRLV